ncbi:MAG: Response regulator [Bacteroidetes bacterium]|nr:Response regulator [Bacteroidota bacterium]
MAIRIVIIEDHDDFREGLFHLLKTTEGFQCVGRYSSVEEAMRKMPEPDVVLLDIGLPGKTGIEAIPDIKARHTKAHVLMMTVFEDDGHIFDAIQAGADGYLLKKTPPTKLLHAIEDAAAGGMPMTPFVARQAIELFKRHVPLSRMDISLTDREGEVLQLLVQGLNYMIIGEKLFISLDTVRNHIRHIYEKLQVHSKAEAVAKAIRQGLV